MVTADDDWETLTRYDSQQPYYTPDGLDSADATRLLRSLPAKALEQRWNDSPTIGTMLRSIATHPQVRGNVAASVGNPTDDFALSGLVIDDPELLLFTPDVALGPVQEWVADLGDELRAEYFHHRAGCLSSSVERQRWYAARHRYELRDAKQMPDEIDVVNGVHGQVLHLWWD